VRARGALTVVFFAHGALFATWAARIPAVQRRLELGNGELGLALLGATLGGVLSLPVAGWLVSRAGSRPVVLAFLPVYALFLPLLAVAPNLPVLVAMLFGFGVGAGTVDVAMNAHGLEVERRRAKPILSSLHAGWSFGGLAGAAAAGGLAAWGVGAREHFAAAALLLGVAGVAASRLLLPATVDRPSEPVRLARPPRQLAILGVVAFCGLLAEGAAMDWSAVYLAGPLAAAPAVAALAFAVFSAAMASFRLAGDVLTTRWGPAALTRRGAVVAASGLTLGLVVAEPAFALVGFACMGAGLAALVPVAFRAAGSLPGIPPAVGIAALTSVGYSAFLVGPPLIGFAGALVGLRTALALVVAALVVLAVLAPATRVAAE
jgi:hypothetical protein